MRWQLGRVMTAVVVAMAGVTGIDAAGEHVMHARVSFDEGGGLVKGLEDSDWSHATVNTLVLPGDTLWVDMGGTLELEMAGGSILRMADGSKCEVTSLRNQNRTAETALASVKKAFSEVRVALSETKTRARRRAMDSWPRVGSTLRNPEDEGQMPVAADLSNDARANDTGDSRRESPNDPNPDAT